MALMKCNYCKKEKEGVDKVIIYDIANKLCPSCKQELHDEIMKTAHRFLDTVSCSEWFNPHPIPIMGRSGRR